MDIDQRSKAAGYQLVPPYLEQLKPFLSDGAATDIRMLANWAIHPPITRNARRIAVEELPRESYFMAASDRSQDLVHVFRVLPRLKDYRTAIASWFRTLKIGGFLVLVVPHQFLFERRFLLPSSIDEKTLRFYTPASLMMEIEEAINIYEYRLRLLYEDASGFSSDETLSDPAVGGRDIVVVLERLETPLIAEQLANFGDRKTAPTAFTIEPRPDATNMPIKASKTTAKPIRRILAIKLDHRGDFILAQTAFSRLRNAFPDAEIEVVCGSWNVGAAQEMGIFDKIHEFSIFEEQAALNQPFLYYEQAVDFSRHLNEKPYDLVLDFRIFGETRFILDLVDTRYRAGFTGGDAKKVIDILLPISPPTDKGRPIRLYYGANAFSANFGSNIGVAIEIPALRGMPAGECLIYGPYCQIERGIYNVTLHLETREPLILGYDVAHTSGNFTLTAGALDVFEGTRTFSLVVDTDISDLEVRIRAPNGNLPPFRFFGFTAVKQGEQVGPHQVELMSLLVTLAEERLKFPTTVDVVTT